MKRLFLSVLILVLFPFCNIYSQFFHPIDTLVLEESEDVFLSSPIFENQIQDQYLVIDEDAHRVIIYEEKGKLIRYFGRYGRGPGDLEDPTSATLLSNDNILVTEYSGKVTIFDSNGNHSKINRTSLFRINDSQLLPNGNLLFTGGFHPPDNLELLYIFDPESMSLEKKFFPIPFDPYEYGLQPASLEEPVHAVLCGDNIVALHTMYPVLFYFDFEGKLLNKTPIDSKLFSQMEPLSNPDNPNEAYEKYSRASWTVDLFCLDQQELLLQFIMNFEEAENPFGLIHVNKNGEVLNESLNMPQVLFSKPGTDTLFLKDKNSELVNHFIKSKLIRE